MIGFLLRWRTRLLQVAVLLVTFVLCFVFIDQTKSEVTLVNRASYPITVEEVFVGNKVANPKIEPYGVQYIHTKDSDVLQDYVLKPNEQIKQTFRVRQSRLFRVAYVSLKGKTLWYETGAVEYWGNRMTVEFTEDNAAVLRPGSTFLRGWVNRNRNSMPSSWRWLD